MNKWILKNKAWRVKYILSIETTAVWQNQQLHTSSLNQFIYTKEDASWSVKLRQTHNDWVMCDSNMHSLIARKRDIHRLRELHPCLISVPIIKMEINYPSIWAALRNINVQLGCTNKLHLPDRAAARADWLPALDKGRHAQISLSVLSPALVAYYSKCKETYCKAE